MTAKRNTKGKGRLTRVKIGPAVKLGRRLLGSHVSARTQRLRLLGDFPTPQPNGDDRPEPPPPLIPPDIGFQLRGKIGARVFEECLSQERQDEIRAALEEKFQQDFENARVIVSCASKRGQPFVLSIGIWTSPGMTSEQDLRDGLNALDLLQDSQTVALYLTASYIKRLVFQSWNRMPKRWNHDGKEDENGSVHLTGLSASLKSPNQVITKVSGFDDSTLPDVDFTLTVTDTLTAASGLPHCEKTKSDLNVDTDRLFLLGFLSLMLGNFLLGVFFLGQGIVAAGKDLERKEGGVGCALAEQIPRDILLEVDPQTGFGKLHFIYSQLEVRPAGIFAAGVYLPEPRDPLVFIEGPTTVSVRAELGQGRARYSMRTVDLREPLEIRWTSGGRGNSEAIFFDIHGPSGETLSKRVGVHVRDADGLEAEKQITVKIKLSGGQGQPL